ncbi:ATP-binding protein [Listeria booriae]|uniref:ATP-binding protein n=1 Tax=Listeria booriae TaxID=1552123 RepID=A0A842B0C4_9LIST|nr:ATP-binding protein [Listeria booriae]MBC1795452.1 ATP-binding protein [Listeria booriae]
MNDLVVGKVLEIEGTKVNVLMEENSNMFTYFYNGLKYRGIAINSFIGIIRGPYKIVGQVVKEFLRDVYSDSQDMHYKKNRFERVIEIKIIGTFINNAFIAGIRAYPLIYNDVVLLNEDEILNIITNGKNDKKYDNQNYRIGQTLIDEIEFKLDWSLVFNTHIGIFGNTGSGKSNTLTKIYTGLFNKNNLDFKGKSNFLLLDFNGEYIGAQLLNGSEKEIISLNTRNDNGDKLIIDQKVIWDKDILSILLSATEKTQKPFLSWIIDRISINNQFESIVNEILALEINKTYTRPSHDSVKSLATILSQDFIEGSEEGRYESLQGELKRKLDYGNEIAPFDINEYPISDMKVKSGLPFLSKLRAAMHIFLLQELNNGHYRLDDIQPMLSRLKSLEKSFDRIIEIEDNYNTFESLLTIISLRNCNQDIKKIVPLLLAKMSYELHKIANEDNINKTFHLIVDEAHNILSDSAKAENKGWQDYRLEVFEEIIKEGRKFGYFLTIASQRPADISPTIMSQLHNYFIHRLVNDNDLRLIEFSISTLDKVSRQNIPNLSSGCCIITGTSFELPLTVKIDYIDCKSHRPNSDNVDLIELWKQ